MSFCRFSSDDFQCDLYCYEDMYGGYRTQVAQSRVVFNQPLPPKIDFTSGRMDDWLARHQVVQSMVREAKRKRIGLPFDGENFVDETLEDFLQRLLNLRKAGYRFPDSVIDAVKAEMAELVVEAY